MPRGTLGMGGTNHVVHGGEGGHGAIQQGAAHSGLGGHAACMACGRGPAAPTTQKSNNPGLSYVSEGPTEVQVVESEGYFSFHF